MKKIKVGRQTRSMTLERAALGADAGEIEFSFSSEFPAERWYGKEILSHAPGAADLSRLNDGGQLLFNHGWDDYIGVIEAADIRSDKRGYVKVRFSNHARAQQIKKDVDDGIIRNVSFGYFIDEMKLTKSDTEKGDEFTATRWTPYEVSFVTVPADPTIGVGRAGDEDETREFEFETEQAGKVPAKEGERSMPPEVDVKPVDVKVVQSEAVRAERERISAITALCEKHGQGELARQMIEGGRSLDECREAVLEKISVRQAPITGKEADIGLTEKEVNDFSFIRAINALANPTNRKLVEAAKFEFEVSRAAAQKRGKEAQGIFIPYEILRAQRDLSKGTPSAGGYLVGTDHRADAFIEMLRKKSALSRAGVRTLNGLVGDIAIPKQTGGATAYWVGEGSAPTESQQTFGQVAMAPKTVGAYTDMSRKLVIQSSPDVENLVKQDLATVLALAIDLAGLYGTGSSNQPLGVSQVSGINTKDLAGEAPTYLEAIDMETLIAADDADVDAMSYILNATMRGALKGTVKFSSTDSQTVWEQGNMINGYNAIVSNQVTNGDIFFGNWNDLIMGMWSGLDMNVDTAALATSGGLRVIVLQDVDVAVRHAESFCFANNDQ